MSSAGDLNPYASPDLVSQTPSDAEREIRAVIRVFRYLGWFGLLFWAPAMLGTAFLFLYSLLTTSKEPPLFLFAVSLFHGLFAAVFVAFLYLAWRMAHRNREARGKALLACSLILWVFPWFTIVGAICIYKIRRHYVAYCTQSSP